MNKHTNYGEETLGRGEDRQLDLFYLLVLSPWLQRFLYLIPNHVLERPVRPYTYQHCDTPKIKETIGSEKKPHNKPITLFPTFVCFNQREGFLCKILLWIGKHGLWPLKAVPHLRGSGGIQS